MYLLFGHYLFFSQSSFLKVGNFVFCSFITLLNATFSLSTCIDIDVVAQGSLIIGFSIISVSIWSSGNNILLHCTIYIFLVFQDQKNKLI